MWIQSVGWEDHLEEGMATHFRIHTWRLPWTEEPGRSVHGVTKSQTQLERLSIAQPPVPTILLPVPTNLTPRGASYQWDHIFLLFTTGFFHVAKCCRWQNLFPL